MQYTPLSTLDDMIRCGWENVPQRKMPANWREKPGPGGLWQSRLRRIRLAPDTVLACANVRRMPRRAGERFPGAYREGLKYRRAS